MPIREAVVDHLRERLGEEVRIVGCARKKVVSSTVRRTFHRLTVQTGSEGPKRRMHVQLTQRAYRHRDRHRLDAYLSERGFSVPTFFGVVERDDLVAAVWEDCKGEAHKSFGQMSRAHLRGLLRSVAAVSACAEDVQDFANVPRSIRWVHPIAEEIASLANEFDVLHEHQSDIEHLHNNQDAMIRRASEQDLWVLTHNDLVARNTIAGRRNAIWIVDWDSASIAPAGASLRALSSLSLAKQRAAIEVFTDEMLRYGHMVQPADVLFTIQVQQIFWRLSSGHARRDIGRIMDGLRHFRKFTLE